jgi:hypothetical protein
MRSPLPSAAAGYAILAQLGRREALSEVAHKRRSIVAQQQRAQATLAFGRQRHAEGASFSRKQDRSFMPPD